MHQITGSFSPTFSSSNEELIKLIQPLSLTPLQPNPTSKELSTIILSLIKQVTASNVELKKELGQLLPKIREKYHSTYEQLINDIHNQEYVLSSNLLIFPHGVFDSETYHIALYRHAYTNGTL